MTDTPVHTPSPTQIAKYQDHLVIPLVAPEGDKTIFLNELSTVLAQGYLRVVIGDRGPYIEFDRQHLAPLNDFFKIPTEERWRITSKKAYYVEWRSNDPCNIKLYEQKKQVAYADYRIGRFYVSPEDFYTREGRVLRPKEDKQCSLF